MNLPILVIFHSFPLIHGVNEFGWNLNFYDVFSADFVSCSVAIYGRDGFFDVAYSPGAYLISLFGFLGSSSF